MQKTCALTLTLTIMAVVKLHAADPIPPTVAPGATLAIVYQNNGKFFEGPTWDPAGQKLYFTTPNDSYQIFQLTPPNTVVVWLSNTQRVNGTYLSNDGRLLGCQGTPKNIISYGFGPSSPTDSAIIANNNSLIMPNDICQTPRGDIYFTDPDFSGGTSGGVYRVSPGSNQAIKVISDMRTPNGIVAAPDGRTLYVAESCANCAASGKIWRSYPINSDGSVGAGQLFFSPNTASSNDPDGMTFDESGNLYFCGRGGVYAVTPQGTLLGFVPVAEFNSNCDFGGVDGKTLYITCQNKVYSLQMTVRGGRFIQARKLMLSGLPVQATTGQAYPVTVTIKDWLDNTVTGYAGTVHFNSSDAQAALPADYTFSAQDAGTKVFDVTFNSKSSQSLTAGDTALGYLSGSQAGIAVKENQTILFDDIPDKVLGDPGFNASAMASSGLPVSFAIDSGPATIDGSEITINGAGDVTVRASQEGDSNYNAAPNATQTFSVKLPNQPPVIISGPSATKTTLIVGEAVEFTAQGFDPDGDSVTIAWDFADGTTATGTSVSHAYDTAGPYTVIATVSDGSHAVSANLVITVVVPQAFTLNVKSTIKFVFNAASKDSLFFSGTLPLTVGYVPAGKMVKVSIGQRVLPSLMLTSRLSAGGTNTVFKFKAKLDRHTHGILATPVPFTLKLKKYSLYSSLQELGFTNSTAAPISVTVPVLIDVGGYFFSTSTDFDYFAKAGKTGTAKQSN